MAAGGLGSNLLVLEVVSRVRVRLQGEGEEVDAGVVGREDGPRAVPPVVGVGSLGNSYIRQHNRHNLSIVNNVKTSTLSICQS